MINIDINAAIDNLPDNLRSLISDDDRPGLIAMCSDNPLILANLEYMLNLIYMQDNIKFLSEEIVIAKKNMAIQKMNKVLDK